MIDDCYPSRAVDQFPTVGSTWDARLRRIKKVADAIERVIERFIEPRKKETNMFDILHRIGATTTPDQVYNALTTLNGLADWWTTDTTGAAEPGGTIKFRFGEAGGFDMKVLEQRANARVEWEVIDGPAEWIGTHVSFDLKEEDGYTIVLFKHEGWREPVEFMAHCSTKWATFLMSLKQLVETGSGDPFPREVRISNWT